MAAGGAGTHTVHLQGIDPSRTYKITLDNTQHTFTIPGSVLYLNGLTVTVPSALTSELVLYEATE